MNEEQIIAALRSLMRHDLEENAPYWSRDSDKDLVEREYGDWVRFEDVVKALGLEGKIT